MLRQRYQLRNILFKDWASFLKASNYCREQTCSVGADPKVCDAATTLTAREHFSPAHFHTRKHDHRSVSCGAVKGETLVTSHEIFQLVYQLRYSTDQSLSHTEADILDSAYVYGSKWVSHNFVILQYEIHTCWQHIQYTIHIQ